MLLLLCFCEIVESFFQSLKKSGYRLRSIKRKYSALKMFLSYLKEQNLVDEDIVFLFSMGTERQLPRALTRDQVDRFIKTPFCLDSRFKFRNKAIIELLYSTGIRVSELIHISFEDLDFF